MEEEIKKHVKKFKNSTFSKDFKAFITRGNVVDMAVGVIVGGAFGKIVTSLVNDIIMPLIGVLIGPINFADLKITLSEAMLAADGTVEKAAVTLNYGNFIQLITDFLIIALSIFTVIRIIGHVRKKAEKLKAAQQAAEAKAAEAAPKPEPEPEPEPQPTKEELLLTEIRDILARNNEKS